MSRTPSPRSGFGPIQARQTAWENTHVVVLGPFHPGDARMNTSIGTRAAMVANKTDERIAGETEGIGLEALARDLLLVGGTVHAPVLVPVLAREDVRRDSGASKLRNIQVKRMTMCISNQKRVCAGSISQSRGATRWTASSSTWIKKEWAGTPQNGKKNC